MRVSFVDRGGSLESLVSDPTTSVVSAVIAGQVQSWNGTGVIAGVTVAAHDPVDTGDWPMIDAMVSDTNGEWRFDGLDFDQYAIRAARVAGVDDLLAITSADAMAALKLTLGRNPNPDPDGPGPLLPAPISPHQLIAADIDQDGRLTRDDAQANLRLSQGVGASSWVFLQEAQPIPPGSYTDVPASTEIFAYADLLSDVQLTGVLLGDVNGSWPPVV